MKILIVSIFLLLGTRGGVTGRIKTHSFSLQPPQRQLGSRKTMVITGATQPTTDASIYTRAPNPPGNFVYKIPPIHGSYLPKAAPVEPTYQPVLRQAKLNYLSQGGEQIVQMPTNQYQQLFSQANSNRFATPSALAKGDFQNKFIGYGQNFASKFAEKTSALGTIGSALLGNALKIQSGVVSNAQNEYVNVYAAQKNSELAEASTQAIDSLQTNQINAIQSNPLNSVTPKIGPNTSMYSSSYASGYRSKI
jgi:hypothetical protein